MAGFPSLDYVVIANFAFSPGGFHAINTFAILPLFPRCTLAAALIVLRRRA